MTTMQVAPPTMVEGSLLGLIPRGQEQRYWSDPDKQPSVLPAMRYLDWKSPDLTEHIGLTIRGHEMGLVRYFEESEVGLTSLVRTLSTPPHGLVHTPRAVTINFVEPQNPEDFGIAPGIYAEKHYVPSPGQQLEAGHIHILGPTYFDLVEHIGVGVLKLEELLKPTS